MKIEVTLRINDQTKFRKQFFEPWEASKATETAIYDAVAEEMEIDLSEYDLELLRITE